MIGVVLGDPSRDADLRGLAERHGYALMAADDPAGRCLLLRDARGLCLRARLPSGTCEVRAAMLSPRLAVQRRNSLLARAVGGTVDDLVVDATCGLGRDAHELAVLRYRVVAYERHPVLALLVRDALGQSQLPIELHETDATAALLAMPPHAAQAVCLDPMFPPRRKQARVKKEAEVLQLLVDRDTESDTDALFAAAWHAGRRVVVKRPLHAPPLAAGVDFVVAGRAVRLDVYLTPGRAPAPRTPAP